MPAQEFDEAVREVRSALSALKCELAAQRVPVAARHVSALLRKAGFDLEQPRDDQGRRTDAGAGEAEAESEDAAELFLIGGPDGGLGRPIDLLDEEAAGGHTVKQHVGKSDEYLLARVRGDQGQFGIFTVSRKRAGPFPSVEAANKLVNATLADNTDTVAAVSSGKRPGAFITSEFDSPTGKEAYARTPRS